jgi:hypothetical protein
MEEKKRGRKRAVVGEEADVRPLRPINEVRRIKGGGTGGRPQARRGTSRPVRRMGGDWGAGGGRGMCAGEEEAHAKTSKSKPTKISDPADRDGRRWGKSGAFNRNQTVDKCVTD